MGDAVTIYRLREQSKLYKKWTRLDKDARRFVLAEHLDKEISDASFKSAVREWRKQERERIKDRG